MSKITSSLKEDHSYGPNHSVVHSSFHPDEDDDDECRWLEPNNNTAESSSSSSSSFFFLFSSFGNLSSFSRRRANIMDHDDDVPFFMSFTLNQTIGLASSRLINNATPSPRSLGEETRDDDDNDDDVWQVRLLYWGILSSSTFTIPTTTTTTRNETATCRLSTNTNAKTITLHECIIVVVGIITYSVYGSAAATAASQQPFLSCLIRNI